MRLLSSYLLAILGGKEKPTASDISNILSSVGIDVTDESITKLLHVLNDKNIEDVLRLGHEKLAEISFGKHADVTQTSSTDPNSRPNESEVKNEPKDESVQEEEMEFESLFD